ncbi:MAG: EAL domain-containing protein [Treponema sp.]|nr:EAL domain-containing protein [Treponema sp.]
MDYILEFDISALFISFAALLIFVYKKDRHKRQNRTFFLLIVTQIVTTTCDFVGAYTINNHLSNLWVLSNIVNLVYFITHTFLPILFVIYILDLTGLIKRHNKYLPLIFVPYIILFLLQISNPFTHFIFTIDENLNYYKGPLILPLYLSAFMYMVLCQILIIHFRSTISVSRFLLLTTFTLLILASTVVQFIYPRFLVECFVQITMTLCLMITVDNPSEIFSLTTGVYNRNTFILDNINFLKNKVSYKLVIIKILNEEYYMSALGYSYMQEILKSIAQWFVMITSEDCVYDCNNGNFAIILYGQRLKKADQILTYLSNRFSTDWLHKDIILSLETQICDIDIPADVNNVESIVTIVDAPGIKQSSKVSIIKREQLSFMQRVKAIQNTIAYALDNNLFQVYYQPIYDVHADKIHSAEALARLHNEEMGFISPDEFIPIAEKNGSIIAIGQFVFEETCKMFSIEQLNGIGIEFLEVNLSTVQCNNKKLSQIFLNTMSHYNLKPNVINLEITESVAINSHDTFLQTIKDLHNAGFTFSLDDYGTGYSNASYIFNMDFDIIKIDKTILWEAEKSESALIILQNTVRMIKELNKKILVEGVETKAQRDLMVQMGADYLQGYYFSKPLPKQDFIEYCKMFNRYH